MIFQFTDHIFNIQKFFFTRNLIPRSLSQSLAHCGDHSLTHCGYLAKQWRHLLDENTTVVSTFSFGEHVASEWTSSRWRVEADDLELQCTTNKRSTIIRTQRVLLTTPISVSYLSLVSLPHLYLYLPLSPPHTSPSLQAPPLQAPPPPRGKALFHVTIHHDSWSDCELEGDSPFPEYPVEDLDWRSLHLRCTLPQSQRVAVSYFLEGKLDVCRRRHGHPALELVVCFLDNKHGRMVNGQNGHATLEQLKLNHMSYPAWLSTRMYISS